MIGRIAEHFAANPPAELKAVVTLMELSLQKDAYKELINRQFEKRPDFSARRQLLEIGHFSGQDFLELVHACSGQSGSGIQIISSLLDKLVEWGLVLDSGILGGTLIARYHWSHKRIEGFVALNIIDNVMLGPSFIATKYRSSVPAVFVEKGGDQFTGTGFLASLGAGPFKNVVVTAKHNVDPADGISFQQFSEPEGSAYKPLLERWVLHPTLDLALMPVEVAGSAIPIFPVSTPAVLSRTITLGYPRIGTADAPYLLAHGGELNAVVKNYYGVEHLIISNIVSPGNSGGPVLDEAGLCLGIVVNALEAEHEGGISKANAAIPAGPILHFIAPYCG